MVGADRPAVPQAPFDHRIREYQTTLESVTGSHFLVDFRLKPESGFTLEESTFRLLLITSVGTIKPLHFEPGHNRGLIKATIDSLGGYILIQEDPHGSGLVTIALPLHLCSERESLAGLLQLIGSGAEYAYTSEYWIERLTLPRTFVERYDGPRFGVAGMRERLRVFDRAPLGIVMKPRHGVGISSLCKVATEALSGGCDMIVDDVLLGDPDGEISLVSRVPAMVQVAQTQTAKTGERKSYYCNLSGSPAKCIRDAVWAIEQGVDGIIVNAFSLGLGGLEDLVSSLPNDLRVPIITTDMGVALMSRAPTRYHDRLTQTGMSEAIFAKMCRLAGVDGVHTGTVGAECYGEMEWNRISRAVQEPMATLRPCFAVAEGDLGLAQLWANVSSLGPNVLIEVTSGIINFPRGIGKGAEAFRLILSELDPRTMDDRAAMQTMRSLASKDKAIREVLEATEIGN